MGDAPNIIVRHRDREGTIIHSDVIARFWKHKETGEAVMVTKHYNAVGPAKFGKIVIFVTDSIRQEMSMDYPDFVKQHEAIGNTSDKF